MNISQAIVFHFQNASKSRLFAEVSLAKASNQTTLHHPSRCLGLAHWRPQQ